MGSGARRVQGSIHDGLTGDSMRARRWWPGVWVALCLALPSRGYAQASALIWGTVRTTAGSTYEGFIRWDRNEAAWTDALHGQKQVDRDLLDRMAESLGEDVELRGRSVEYLGVRISWEDDGDAEGSLASVRFGHLAWLEPVSETSARLGLKSGEEMELRGSSTDLGSGLRELVVHDPGTGAVELTWAEVEHVAFAAAPAGAMPPSDRLYGTVEDRWGASWTGFISWDLDEAVGTDVLDGEEDGTDREIPFERIRSIERRLAGGARVQLVDGEAFVLEGSNDVGPGHRGVQVSDPALGLIDFPWRDVRVVRFATPPATPVYDDFDGGRELEGTVVTRDGERWTGRVIWDADEAWSWEVLNGSDRGVDFEVELAMVARIERRSSRSAEVTLRDGREIVLEGSTDIGRSNRGIVVELEDGSIRIAEWNRLESLALKGREDG